MNLFGFFIVGMLALTSFYRYSKMILERTKSASHSYPNETEDCPKNLADYAFSEYPKHCIPPPTDHGSSYLPTQGAPLAICMFVNGLRNPGRIEISLGERGYSCKYL